MADRLNTPGGAVGPFDRLKALVDNGWLSVLNRIEMSLWLAYFRYADRDGFARPSPGRIAVQMGHARPQHVRTARKRLEDYGLLKRVQAGGGSESGTVQLLLPGKAPKAGCGDATLPGFGVGGPYPDSGHPTQDRDATLPGFGVGTLPGIGTPLNKDEQSIEQSSEQRASAGEPRGPAVSPADDAGAGRPGKRTGRKLTPEQHAVWEAFIGWWTEEAYPAVNEGEPYEFGANGSRNGKAVREILSSRFVGWDLDRGKAVAAAFLAEPDEYLSKRGHVLYDLAERLSRFVGIARRRMNGHAPAALRKPTADEREAELNRLAIARLEAGM